MRGTPPTTELAKMSFVTTASVVTLSIVTDGDTLLDRGTGSYPDILSKDGCVPSRTRIPKASTESSRYFSLCTFSNYLTQK